AGAIFSGRTGACTGAGSCVLSMTAATTRHGFVRPANRHAHRDEDGQWQRSGGQQPAGNRLRRDMLEPFSTRDHGGTWTTAGQFGRVPASTADHSAAGRSAAAARLACPHRNTRGPADYSAVIGKANENSSGRRLKRHVSECADKY